MKKILFLLLLVTVCSCKEQKEIPLRDIQFIVTEKVTLPTGEYFLKSKDTVIQCNPKDFMRYDVKDTINFVTPTEGFFRGRLYIK